MRIIAGTLKGRRLARPVANIRPTSDRLREAVFSYLSTRVADSVWLDVFAGSGAIGLEALSRGARHVYFNDRSRSALRLLRQNLQLCHVDAGFTLSRFDAFRFLREPKEEAVDFIYLDPPYQSGFETRLLRAIENGPRELSGATVLLEHFKKNPVPSPPTGRQIVRTLRAGDSWVEVIEPG